MISLLLSAAVAFATPAEVLIIRHAEKPVSLAKIASSDDLKNDEGSDLSPRGFQRAQALVSLFTTDSRFLTFGRPVAIYAGSPKKAGGSVRPLQTIQPTAQALGLTPRTNYLSEDFDSMVSEVMASHAYDGKTVLISWPHDEIPEMAHSFGLKRKKIPSWPGDIFDRVWRIDFSEDGDVTDFEDLPQHLLPGDSAE